MEPIWKLIDRLPAPLILLLPIAAILALVYYLIGFLPADVSLTYSLLFALFGIVILSRALQLWEFGLETYHLIIFCFAFANGIVPALGFVLLSSVIVLYSAFTTDEHWLNHSVNGPVIQTVELLVVATIAGFLSRYPDLVMGNLVMAGTGVVTIGLMIDGLLCHKFTGIDFGRIFVSRIIGILVNYNLFLVFGYRLIGTI